MKYDLQNMEMQNVIPYIISFHHLKRQSFDHEYL